MIMNMNKIQKKIYDEYKRVGKVWGECPRQCGKTELLVYIAKEELENKKKIFYRGTSKRMELFFKNLLGRKSQTTEVKNLMEKFMVTEERYADVILYDEIYYDLLIRNGNRKIICLRTPIHKTLRFNYLDMEKENKKYITQLKKSMSKEEFDLEFNKK